MSSVEQDDMHNLPVSEGYWQPMPANGYVEIRVSPLQYQQAVGVEQGIQVVAPGGSVRKHRHNGQQELILVFEGEGVAEIDGREYPMFSGASFYLAPHKSHRFTNTGEGELKFFWVFLPGGLADFFRRVGRPRHEGEVPPSPFARPDNINQIEAETVFAPLQGS